MYKGEKEILNIGIGLILLFVVLLFFILGMFLCKKGKKVCSNSWLIVGILILLVSLVLFIGLYDLYVNYI